MAHRPRCARHVVPAAASMPGLRSEREGHPLCSSSGSAPRSTLPGPDPAVRGRAAAALHPNRAKVSRLRDPRQCPKPVHVLPSSPSGTLGLRAIREPAGPRAPFYPMSWVSHHPQTSPPRLEAAQGRSSVAPGSLHCARCDSWCSKSVGGTSAGARSRAPGVPGQRGEQGEGTKQKLAPLSTGRGGGPRASSPSPQASPAQQPVCLCCRRPKAGPQVTQSQGCSPPCLHHLQTGAECPLCTERWILGHRVAQTKESRMGKPPREVTRRLTCCV